jgi:soluble lytic murein transglycosylase-like protein
MLRSIKIATGALCVFAQTLMIPAQAIAADPRTVLNEYGGNRSVASLSSSAKATKTGNPRKDKYASLIRKAAKKHGVPIKIAKAVVEVESNFNSRARGAAGEVGLMQIKPATARGMGYRGSTKALYHPETNLEWGMKYLAGAHDRANGDLCGTILRYNAGHYAKRMNPISRRYCKKVQRILASS